MATGATRRGVAGDLTVSALAFGQVQVLLSAGRPSKLGGFNSPKIYQNCKISIGLYTLISMELRGTVYTTISIPKLNPIVEILF